MINKIIIILLSIIALSTTTAFSEIKDCNKLKKLSKDYIKCQKDNLKSKSDETTIGKGINKFKSSKTLADLIKKK